MKKFYYLIFLLFFILNFSQPYSLLLKNTNWTITKIEYNNVQYNPPYPFLQAGKVAFNFDENNGFKSVFFNIAGGKVNFGGNNETYFNLQNIAVTLAEYSGENQDSVREFDHLATNFYFGFQPTDRFNFQYDEVFSGKNLIVTNPLGNKIFYSNLILGNEKVKFDRDFSLFPNPANNEFFLKSNRTSLDDLQVEIYDFSGKLISTQKISAGKSVKTEVLSNGIYTVKVIGNDFNSAAKLIIRK